MSLLAKSFGVSDGERVRTPGKWLRLPLRWGVILLAIYAGVVLLLWAAQRTLIYLPSRASEEELIAVAKAEGLDPWKDAAGAIIGWHRPRATGQEPAANRLILFHGNAGYALRRTHYVDGWEALDDGRAWKVYLFEYPGFGAREGKPSEESITKAALAAVETLDGNTPIYLAGESLGSGPACALAARLPGRFPGLFLVTPYSSLTEVAGVLYPYVPVRWILRDRWDNLAAVRTFPGRIGVMLAGEDEIIPVAQGERLYDAAPGVKQLWTILGIGHNELDFTPSASWWGESSKFLLTGVP